jgi:hypothetical protein
MDWLQRDLTDAGGSKAGVTKKRKRKRAKETGKPVCASKHGGRGRSRVGASAAARVAVSKVLASRVEPAPKSAGPVSVSQ